MFVLKSISNMNMNWIFILCALASIASMYALPDKPSIHVMLLCRSTIEVTCDMDSGSYGIWTFYRTRAGLEDMLNMANIDTMKQECRVSALKTTASTNCFCVEDTRVICSITDESIAKSGDQWRCSRFIEGYLHFSNQFTVPSQDTLHECTTTTRLDAITEEEKTTLASSTTSLNVVTETFIEAVNVFTYVGDKRYNNFSTEAIDMFTTTSDSKTKNVNNGQSENGHVNSGLNTAFIGIVAAAGVTVFIAINVSFCVYWKYKPRQIVINHPATGIDISNLQQNMAMTVSALDMYDDENTSLNYHEISEIQLPFTDIVTLSNTMITEANDENEPTFVDSELARRMIGRTQMSLPNSGTGNTLKTTHEPISFLTLADINMADVIAIESETNRTDVKSVRYESLDPTGRADKSQYTTLV